MPALQGTSCRPVSLLVARGALGQACPRSNHHESRTSHLPSAVGL